MFAPRFGEYRPRIGGRLLVGVTVHVSRRCREKFHASLRRLAVGEGDVRSRLRGAYRYLRMLSPEEVPLALRDEWASILKSLTRHGPETGPDGELYRGAVDNTMTRIRNSTGRAIAERVYALVRQID